MKILIADDQQMILKALANSMSDTNYEVIQAVNGIDAISKFDLHHPDIAIIDIDMPGKNGFEVIEHIRNTAKSDVPIMVMSGSEEDVSLAKSFALGANDFIEKPIGVNKLKIRIKKLLKLSLNEDLTKVNTKPQRLEKYGVGVVIPCYNEEQRIKKNEFYQFIDQNPTYHLCFVNDGSTDNTLKVLNTIASERQDNISVYDCQKNGGKAEAVRLGMLHLANNSQYNYIGFLDADLSTDMKDFDGLVHTLHTSSFQMVNGSRIARMGADIHKDGARQIISKTINLIIRKILAMPFQDTQCGAKVMTPDIAKIVFKEKFLTRWLFDVEIFMRMKKVFGHEKAVSMLCEQPLKRWVHEDGSKLSMKDSIKIIGQLMQIAVSYR